MPFGLPSMKEDKNKKNISAEAITQLERRIVEYKDTLENYKQCLSEYKDKLEDYDKQAIDNHLSHVQRALDMTYLKEQGERTIELLGEVQSDSLNRTLANLDILSGAVTEANNKIDGLDKNVVNQLSEMISEFQKQGVYQNKQIETEITANIDKLSRKVKRGNVVLWISLIINVLCFSGLAVVAIFYLG